MASISIEGVTKVYANGVKAVDGVDLDVAEGEFMVLVGPSGCGKTTLLRMVAGLEEITGGTIRIGDRVVNDVPAGSRDVAMVFQSYALFPHMTVARNIGFPLKLRGRPKDLIDQRVREAAEVLGLTEWLERKPGQLSGGQRQRVAMGRALVMPEPSAFLMDEPLSNLDAKLRVRMRAEVSRLQRRIGVATLYVTHDQTEALTMGDRVAVLRGGVLQQCDTPQALYDHPVNLFVAAFIGSPEMNLYEAVLCDDGASVKLGSQVLELPISVLDARPNLGRYIGRKIILGVRPEHLAVTNGDWDGPVLRGDIQMRESLGSHLLAHFNIDARRADTEAIRAGTEDEMPDSEVTPVGEGIALVDARVPVGVDGQVCFSVDVEQLQFFDPADGAAIQRVPQVSEPARADRAG